MSYLVLDTNIIMLDANNIANLADEGVIVVLPETVIDELDARKSGRSEIAYQSRHFGRLLAKAKDTGIEFIDDDVVINLMYEGVHIKIVSLGKYNIPADTDPKYINDRRIIEVARYMSKKDDTVFMSNDVMCRLRAKAFGLTVDDYKEVDNVGFEFNKDLFMDNDTFKLLHGANILEVDPEYKHEHYNYKFHCEETGQVKLATIYNGVINILGKESEKELRRQDVNPKNYEQLCFSRAIQDDNINVVVCDSLAGSGKTLLALSNAIRLVRQKKYSSIIYFRAAVDDVDEVEEVGFLPGLDEKFAVYKGPLEDNLNFIARNRHKSSNLKGEELKLKIEETVDDIIEKCRIEFLTGLGLRGRTLDDCVFIWDEPQGQSPASFQKVVTRMGKNVKLIITGSNNQIDNKYLTKYTNGLSKVLNDCSKSPEERPERKIMLHAVTLTKVERGGIAEWGEELFSSKD